MVSSPNRNLLGAHGRDGATVHGGRPLSPSRHLLIISSVAPANAGGGEIALKRRLEALSGWTWSIISDGPFDGEGDRVSPPRFLQRLQRTRLGRWAHAWTQFHPGRALLRTVDQRIRARRPDLILTVAHGILWPVAADAAQRYRIPLASLFMDWWPELAFVPPRFRATIEERFRDLYRDSQQVFLSSSALHQALGPHPSAQVLYDGAAITPQVDRQRPDHGGGFRILYLGNTREAYAAPLLALYQVSRNIPAIELRIIGPKPDWPEELCQQATARGVYLGALSDQAAAAEMADADALLVVMSHEATLRRRMETSFPSKIAHYCRQQRPILIWAPPYASAAVWARGSNAAVLIDTPDANAVIQQAQRLAADSVWRSQLVTSARASAAGEFDPVRAQTTFREALLAVVNRPVQP